MKKNYSKPEIMFENFSLCTNIAADCENKTHLPAMNECGIEFTGIGIVFTTEMSGCERQFPATEDYNGICYHTPSEGNNLFTS